MSRYIRMRPQSRAWIEDETFRDERPMSHSVEVDSHEAVDTGLMWADGSTVWRAPNPIGFGKDGDWL